MDSLGVSRGTLTAAVFFDLDGTLFDRDATIDDLLNDQAAAFADVLGPVVRSTFVMRAKQLDDRGYRPKAEMYDTLCRELGLPRSHARTLTMDFWSRYHTHCRPCHGLIETLQALKDRGITLGIISNGMTAIQNGVVDALGIRRLMDVILISEAEGVRKPHPEIFHRAAYRVGLRAQQCSYVGDHPSVDVMAARAAGLHAIWKRTTYWIAPACDVHTIDRLGELVG